MIDQITPLETQKVIDLCSGIGGFTLGHLISGGFETVAFCEINQYCQQLLNLRFPNIPIIPDIHDITTESLAGVGVREVDGIIAGLPCPPFSLAGKRLASQDERNLFGEFFRILRQVRPRWAIVENVPGLLTAEGSGFFRGVLWEFAQMGFDVQWGVLSANQVGAIHKRERVWIIATDSQSSRQHTSWNQYTQSGTNTASVGGGDDAYTNLDRCQQQLQKTNKRGQKPCLRGGQHSKSFSQSTFCQRDHGLSQRLGRYLMRQSDLDRWLCAATIPSFHRLSRKEIAALTPDCQKEYRQLYAQYQSIRRQHKQQLIALGNAIVPQCAALIFERLKRILSQQQKIHD
ncbi:DNA cytosine methyltransferase [Nostoc favosum]|uniref:Cytosine-specific methyltransferase n=1 Tax=Nostoc favosum CHAB5714 TaxID=2780399 RepID=A0ABS8IK60_9NOSO|nr:DNA cytosine methyltransferase [Nostoc favosum]MCC5604186.1 DNA cytosine methyltransferase [Nostoc favosum CHAB5714]